MTHRVAIVGAGISGLVVAYRLAEAGVDVSVYEGGAVAGGKARTSLLGGQSVDEGADAFLVRERAMVDLCNELGLGDQLVAPATGRAAIVLPDGIRWLPGGHLLGVPFDLDALAASGLVSAAGVERARADLTMAANAPEGDESVGALVRRRLGDQVFERMTDPLLSGINAGSADDLSVTAGMPRLAAAAASGASLVRSLQAFVAANPPTPDEPVFLSPTGGVGAVADALVAQLGDRVHLAAPVADLADLDADAVVLAVPAFAAAPLLTPNAPRTAELLTGIRYASVAVVSAVFPADVMADFGGSGFLVARSSGLLMTACSFASTKWGHLGADGSTIVRLSTGRIDDERHTAMTDDALAMALLDELADVVTTSGQATEVRVTRWPRSLPQYRVGHGGLIDSIHRTLAAETATARPHALVGAAYRGLGLPACVALANDVAARLSKELTP